MRFDKDLDKVREFARRKAKESNRPYLIIRTARTRWSCVRFEGYETPKRFKGYTELIYPKDE